MTDKPKLTKQEALVLARAAREAKYAKIRAEKAVEKAAKIAAKPPKPAQLVTVTLQMRHTFNGRFYGPGTIRVSPTKAQIFLNTEHEALQKEASLSRQEAFLIGVGPGGPMKRQVPWAQFDNFLSREQLPLTNLPGGQR